LRLVENHQVARRQDSLPLEFQADAFLGLFEVEIETPELTSERRLAALPGPDEDDGWKTARAAANQ
jgi:hypothetical protein